MKALSANDNYEKEFGSLERGALYYAGLIFQCTEPCHQRYHTQESANIVWEILLESSSGSPTQPFIQFLHNMAKKFRNGDRRIERGYIVMAMLIFCRQHHFFQESDFEVVAPNSYQTFDDNNRIDVKQILQTHSEKVLPVPFVAVDYMAKEGQSSTWKKLLPNYLKVMNTLCELHNSKTSPLFTSPTNNYLSWSVMYEELRSEEKMIDEKKKLQPVVPFLCLKQREITNDDLKDVNVLQEDRLSWRGEFIPFSGDEVEHPFDETFQNVSCVNAPKLKEGLFVATYSHPKFGKEDVFVVPCTSKEQAFYQCFLDELKPVFGVRPLQGLGYV